MLRILQVWLQQYINQELPDVQPAFRKGNGTRDQIANITGSQKKQDNSRKNIYFCFTDCAKAFVWIIKLWKILKSWEYQTTLPAFWKTCMQDKKQKLKLDMEQWTASKLGKMYVKAAYCHPAYLTYTQSISYEIPG